MKSVDEVLKKYWKGGRTSLHHAVVAGKFPAPRQVSERRIGWTDDDLEDWEKNLPVVTYANSKEENGGNE